MSNVWILSLWLVVSTAGASASTIDLTHALRKYQGVERLSVTFEQTKKLKDMDFEIRSRGDLQYEADRLIWTVTSPAPIRVIWDHGQIQVDGQNQSLPERYRLEMELLLSWLRLEPTRLKNDFEVTSATSTIFDFKPKKAGAFKAMRLRLSPKGFAESVELTETSDDQILLKFNPPRVQYKK